MAELPSLLQDPSAGGALSVFLSSTIKDYEALRREVKEVLDKKAECACFLSEDWSGANEPTVQKCRAKVLQANGFILLLGHWYGSIPPGKDKSITHLEFEWAQRRRREEGFKNIAVLRPARDTKIFQELLRRAQTVIPSEEPERTQHAARLSEFHESVDDRRTEWRIVTEFKSEQDLREHALVIGRDWRGYTLMAAAQRQFQPEIATYDPRVTEAALGRLGRKPQIEAVETVMAGVAGYPDVPGVAMIIFGDEDGGHRALLANLLSTALASYHPKRPIGKLPVGQTSIPALVAWVARTLGLPNASGVETPEQLAEHVADELRHQPLYFIIDRISALAGGVVAFHQKFWKPLWNRLRELRAGLNLVHRLVVVVTDYTGDEAGWQNATLAHDQDEDAAGYSKLLLLPRLAQIRRVDMLKWLDEMKVPDDALGRRAKLADRMLTDDRGQPEALAAHVLDRLRSEPLWPETDPS
jgi:Domain of unknown function (DUF4062)